MELSQKTTGRLALLYDIVSSYSDNPVMEIERIAQQAFSGRVIDRRRLAVLQYRIPFSGFQRETLGQVGKRLDVVDTRVQDLESDTQRKLLRFIPQDIILKIALQELSGR